MTRGVAQIHQDRVATIDQLRQDVTRDVIQIRQEANAVLDASVHSINSNNLRKNYKIMTRANNAHIFPYRNTYEAIGEPLPGRPQPAVPPVLPAVGAIIPSPPFPRDIDHADAFSMDEIEALSMVLNNHFGIVAGDSIAECRHKMKHYLFLTMC